MAHTFCYRAASLRHAVPVTLYVTQTMVEASLLYRFNLCRLGRVRVYPDLSRDAFERIQRQSQT